MKRLLITLTSGIFFLLTLNVEKSQPLQAQMLLRSCLTYPYDLGIDLKQTQSGSFRLLSTSIANIKIENEAFVSKALREATLKAKSNISNFIKLTNSYKDENIKEISLPIRINGKVITKNSQLKNKFNKELVGLSKQLKGVRNIAMCKKNLDYVMVTLEVTNQTISAADFMRNN
jgi:hypothetical protein